MSVPMTDWQPIETAPKDGTSVLFYLRHGGFCFGGWQEWEDSTGKSMSAWQDNGEGFTLDPTHWMPLPAPPEAK